MRLKKWIFSMFLVLTGLIYAIEIENLDFNERLDAEGYNEVALINKTTEKQMYRVSIGKGKKNDGSKYVEVQPKVITVMPLSKAKVKLFGVAPQTAEKGEYDFFFKVTPISIPVLAKKSDGKLVTSATTINVAPEVRMYGYVGEVDFQKEIKFRGVKFTKSEDKKSVFFEAQMENTSYATIDFGIAFYNGTDKYLTSTRLGTLKAGERKRVKVKVPNVSGIDTVKRIDLYRFGPEGMKVYKVAREKDGWQ